MARMLRLSQSLRHEPLELLRALVVCGCALALIAARAPIPY
jgi:hypothetical protein